jgi:hypothetical protein
MTDIVNPNWVQAGELGLAFVVIILCVWLVTFVMKKSAERENMLMSLIDGQQEKLADFAKSFSRVADGFEDIVRTLEDTNRRLEEIEDKLKMAQKRKPSTRTRKGD